MFLLQFVRTHIFTSTFCSLVCATACASASQRLFLWLSQAPPALQTLWRWRRWQTVRPSWPGAPAETTAAPSPITSSRPGLPSLWAGRGLTQVGIAWRGIFILYHMEYYSDNSWIPTGKFSYFSSLFSWEVRVQGHLHKEGSGDGWDSGSYFRELGVIVAAFTWSLLNHFIDLCTCLRQNQNPFHLLKWRLFG